MATSQVSCARAVKRAAQVHRAIAPTVGFLHTLRDQLERGEARTDDPFYQAVEQAHEHLRQLFMRSARVHQEGEMLPTVTPALAGVAQEA